MVGMPHIGSRAGIVRYVGKTQFNKKGIWIGVSLDGPTGKVNVEQQQHAAPL